jgi:hypothetical protein
MIVSVKPEVGHFEKGTGQGFFFDVNLDFHPVKNKKIQSKI